MTEYKGHLEDAMDKADEIITKYSHVITNQINYRCDVLLVNIMYSEEIVYESHPFSGDLCGFLILDESEKTIVYNSNQLETRRNFTLAHELGHYFLHSKKASKFVDRAKNLLDKSNDIFEMQANAFASQLIIPKDILFNMIKSKYTFFKISKTTKVSYQALTWIIINHLSRMFNISRDDSIMIVEDYKDFSIGSRKNLVHHGFAIIFKLNFQNYKKIIESYKNGNRPFEFSRDLGGEVFAIKRVVGNPIEHYNNI